MAQWDVMQAAYHPRAIVDISWISGSAAEYVARSKQNYEQGSRSLHLLGAVLVRVTGDRATADVGAQILIPGSVRGVTGSCLTCLKNKEGKCVTTCPGLTRPGAIAQLYSRNTAWLKGVA